MKSFTYDLGYLRAGLELLEAYLLAEDVFWPMDASPPEGEPEYPRLTLGGMLLAEARLKAYPLSQAQEPERQRVLVELEHVRTKWRVNWERKARHSLTVRLRMWADYIEEYRSNPQDNAGRYRYEVRLRAMLELLESESGEMQPVEGEILSGLDRYLKSELEIGDFIWEPEIKSGFPPETYWYLYGKLGPGASR